MISTAQPAPEHTKHGQRHYSPSRHILASGTDEERVALAVHISTATISVPVGPGCDRLRAGRLAEVVALLDIITMIERRIDTLIPGGVDG